MNKTNKRKEWEVRIEDWKASGLSKARWCRENGLKEHQMYYWIQKIDGSESQTKQMISNKDWLPVQITDERKSEPNGSIYIHLDHMSVEVQPGVDIQLLSNVVRVLQL